MKTSTILIFSIALLGCGDLDELGNELDAEEFAQAPLSQTERCNIIQTKRNENSWLGSPTTGCMFHTAGAWRFYQGGNIFFGDAVGRAHLVYGSIAGKYVAMGAQDSVLQWPTTDEATVRFGGGRFNFFQFGYIYWKTGAAQAREVHGAIGSEFGWLGFEYGNLGWPTSDEYVLGSRRKNDFEFGKIYWKASTGPWPTMTTAWNPNAKLTEANAPRISSVTMSGSGTGAFLSAAALGFTPGARANIRLTRPDTGVAWYGPFATVNSSGNVSFPSTFVDSSGIIKANGHATVWVYQDDLHQAVIGKSTAAGTNYAGTL